MNNIRQTDSLEVSAEAYWSADKSSLLKSLVKTAISKRRTFIPLVDSFILTTAVASILVLFEGSFLGFTVYHKVLYLLFSVIVTLLSFYIFGLYDNIESIKPADLAYRFIKVFLIASAMNVIVCMLFGMKDYLGYTTLLFGILGWCVCLRHLFLQMILPQPLAKRLLVVCSSDESFDIAESLAHSDDPVYNLAGCIVIDNSRLEPATIFPLHYGNDFLKAADEMDANVIALTDDLPEKSALEINKCLDQGLEVAHLFNVYEKTLGKLPLSRATFLRNYRSVNRPLYVIAKRTLDIMISLIGNLCLLLILLPVSVAIKSTSPGPIFYTQVRCGKNGRTFKFYKFRTMAEDAERKGPRLTIANDPRITAVGRFLRRMHIDEIPQFLNLLRGDLSLVGPRPERPEIISRYKNRIPFFEYRHLIKPGITGWAQVNAPYASTVEALKEKVKYDFFYIKNRCFFLDLVILLKTAKSIVQMRGQ